MKIAYILPSLLNAGPIVVANTLIKNIITKVTCIDVYYFDDKFGLDFPCNTIKLDINKPIDFDNYDIIHSHGFRPDKYIHNWRDSIKRAKTVTTIHQNIFRDIYLNRGLIKAMIAYPIWIHYMTSKDCCVPISNYIFELYAKKLPNIANTIYNGISITYSPSQANSEYVTQIKQLKDKKLTVVATYANLIRRKGIDQLLNLGKRRPDLGFVIIGDGKEKDNLIKISKSISNRVVFLPYVQQPYNYLSFCDIFAMPSRNEGFGLALVEGAVTETPIVCSNISVFNEIFDANSVSYFELEDLDSLSMAVDNAIKNKQLLIKNAYQRYLHMFSGDIMANMYLNLYQDLIRQSKRHSF